MNATRILFLVVLLAFLIVPATSTTAEWISAGSSFTGKGPYDILVSLGLELVLPLAQARIYYNWLSVLILTSIAAVASQRTVRFFGVLIPIMAGLLMYFGWFTMIDTANSTKLIGTVIVGLIIAILIYMKDSLHERFGIAGPGSPMFNVVFFIILLQAMVGFVNSTAIWTNNAAPTASTAYSNIDLKAEVTHINQNSGALGSVVDTASIISQMVWGCIQMFISIGIALCMFSVTLAAIYPWIWQSAYGPAFLVVLQLGIYIIYYMAFMRFIVKTSAEGDF